MNPRLIITVVALAMAVFWSAFFWWLGWLSLPLGGVIVLGSIIGWALLLAANEWGEP